MAASSAELYLGNIGVESWSDLTPERWRAVVENLPVADFEKKKIVQRLHTLAEFNTSKQHRPELYKYVSKPYP